MKKNHLLAILLSLLCVTFFASCSSDDETEDTQEETSISISGNSAYTIAKEAGSVEVTVTYKGNLSYNTDADWLTITPNGSAVDGKQTFTLSATENTTESSRTATATFNVGQRTRQVSITQDGTVEETKTFGTTKDGVVLESVTQGDAPLLGMGWNLGNQFDAYDNGVGGETKWGQPKCTQATFDAIAAVGFTSVRIPITWVGNFSETSPYTIDETYLDRIAEVIGYAKNAGLKVIINMHHDGSASDGKVNFWLNITKATNSEDDYNTIIDIYTSLWKQIAEKFKDEGDYLVFEAYNEIHDGNWGYGVNTKDGGKQYATLNKWAQAFVTTVRSVGGENATRYLGIPGYSTNPDLTMKYLQIPEDSAEGRILIAIHDYDPYDYTLADKYHTWGHTSSDVSKGSNEDYLQYTMKQIKSKFIDKGYPVYFGEIGCVRRSTDTYEEYRKYYLEFFTKCCRSYGISALFWDNGAFGTGEECSGLINHGTGVWQNDGEEIAKAMVKGMLNNDADYTLQSVFDSAPSK